MRVVIFFLTLICFLFSHFANAFYFEDLGNSWSKHEKFGTFYDAKQTGWYYHLSHGWIYVHEWNDEGTWFYIPLTNKSLTTENNNTSERKVAFGWSWSQPQFYPMLYNNHLKAWLYYNKERNKSKFYYYPLKRYISPDMILEIEEIELSEVAKDSKKVVKSSGGRTISIPPRTEPATPQGGRTIYIPPRTEPATPQGGRTIYIPPRTEPATPQIDNSKFMPQRPLTEVTLPDWLKRNRIPSESTDKIIDDGGWVITDENPDSAVWPIREYPLTISE